MRDNILSEEEKNHFLLHFPEEAQTLTESDLTRHRFKSKEP